MTLLRVAFVACVAQRTCLDPELGRDAVVAAHKRSALMARPGYIGVGCMRSQSRLLCPAEALLATCRVLDRGFGMPFACSANPS